MDRQDYEKKRVTIYQVAKESGYSLATVSRVINNKDNVTEETKKRVHEVIERLGYKPSAIAQGLAKSKSTNIGIVIPSSLYTYVANMLSGMVDIAKIYGYQTTLFFTSQVQEEASEIVDKVILSNVDGAVIFDDQLSTSDISKLASYSIPVAVIGREIEGNNVASIPLKYEDSIRKVVNYHFSCGDEEIVFLHINNGGALIENFEHICHDECVRIGKGEKFKTVIVDDSYSKTYLQFKDYFKNVSRSGCFIAPRDSISCGVTNAAIESGIKIPEEVQILSVIGSKYSMIARPSLTSFDIDMYEVGSIAMRMLTKLLTGTLKNKTYPFISKTTYRDSTRK